MANEFQEHISHLLKHGVARSNRFQLLIPLPNELLSRVSNTAQSKTSSILGGGDVLSLISSFVGGSSNDVTRGLNLMIEQTEIPGKNLTTSDIKYNGDFYRHAYAIVYGMLPFTFKVSRDMYEKNIIDEWMNIIIDPRTHEVRYMDDYVVDITINQLDEQDNVVYSVVLKDCFPTMCNPMTSSNEEMNVVHRLMCMFSYRRWERVGERENQNGPYASLSQTVFGPILAPILSNPAIQKALDIFENATGIDLEGEAVNIYNQVENIVRATTGSSVNTSVGVLEEIKARTENNQKIEPLQKAKVLEVIENAIGSLRS